MDQEFAGVPEDSPGSQSGIAADSGSQARKPEKIDLTTIPEYRQVQSEYDRKLAQKENEAAELRRRLTLQEQQLAVVQKVITESGGEDVARQLAREAELADLRSRVEQADRMQAQMEAQANVENWKQSQRGLLREMGLEVTPEFESALVQATTAGDSAPVMRYIARASQTKQNPPVPRDQPKTEYTLPPDGGATDRSSSVSDKQEREKYERMIAEARQRGDRPRIEQIRTEMRRKGLI